MNKLKYSIIKNQEQYTRYCNTLEQLIAADQEQYMDEIELLNWLIDKYNEDQMKQFTSELDPVELLQELMTENNITQITLARETNISPQLINDILKYRREISKRIAYILSETFKVQSAAFLKPYEVKKAG